MALNLCCCQVMKRAVWNPEYPIGYDSIANSFQLNLVHDGTVAIRFCPFCGSPLAGSEIPEVMCHINESELREAEALFIDMSTIDAVTCALGTPRHEIQLATNSHGEPVREYIYCRWNTFVVHVLDYPGRPLAFTIVPVPGTKNVTPR